MVEAFGWYLKEKEHFLLSNDYLYSSPHWIDQMEMSFYTWLSPASKTLRVSIEKYGLRNQATRIKGLALPLKKNMILDKFLSISFFFLNILFF